MPWRIARSTACLASHDSTTAKIEPIRFGALMQPHPSPPPSRIVPSGRDSAYLPVACMPNIRPVKVCGNRSEGGRGGNAPWESNPRTGPVINSRSMADVPGSEPPQFGIGSFLFIVVLAAILFLLAQTMVRHRFHEGGRINRNGTLRQ